PCDVCHKSGCCSNVGGCFLLIQGAEAVVDNLAKRGVYEMSGATATSPRTRRSVGRFRSHVARIRGRISALPEGGNTPVSLLLRASRRNIPTAAESSLP